MLVGGTAADDADELLAFFDYPDDYWIHLRIGLLVLTNVPTHK